MSEKIKSVKQLIFRTLEKSKRPLNYKQIAKKIRFIEKKIVLEILEDLVKKKKLEVNNNYKFFIKKEETETTTGYVEMVQKNTFFKKEGSNELIPLFSEKTPPYFNRDYINVSIYYEKGRRKAKFLNMIKRHKTKFVGMVERAKNHCFVIPSDKKIKTDFYIAREHCLDAQNNDNVIIELLDWPQKAKSPFGKIITILGKDDSLEATKKSILHKYDIAPNFKKETIAELKKIKEQITSKDKKERKDLRKIKTFTIDPDDAKDFDDAISIQKVNNDTYEIGVHIADVTHYIKEGSSLDFEAYNRGCSVYLENSVIPMIPEKLSNKICSLRPLEDKLCFSVLFEISKNGNIQKSWIGKTIINSNYRLTYQDAQNIIDGSSHKLKNEIVLLHKLSQKFRKKRIENGSVIIYQEETKILFNEDGVPEKAKNKKTLFSNQLIEEFMLLANQEVCNYFSKNKAGVFRIHDKPDIEKLKSLTLVLKKFKFNISAKNLSEEINNLLRKLKNSPNFLIMNKLILRSMAKAKYSTDNIGHFGLGFKKYTHFTSPIRRYPDILVHRELNRAIKKRDDNIDLETKCIYSSKKEKNAIQAEREYKNYLLLWMIRNKENTICEGTVSSIKEWGIYVSLNEYLCEGLLHISRLKKLGPFYFDQKKEIIINKKSGKIFSLGDTISVKIEKINLNYRQLDLSI
tara:strand:- start:173 stop:2230 length:2058 start_codon:yes stop_codon:yes gene_type:complete